MLTVTAQLARARAGAGQRPCPHVHVKELSGAARRGSRLSGHAALPGRKSNGRPKTEKGNDNKYTARNSGAPLKAARRVASGSQWASELASVSQPASHLVVTRSYSYHSSGGHPAS